VAPAVSTRLASAQFVQAFLADDVSAREGAVSVDSDADGALVDDKDPLGRSCEGGWRRGCRRVERPPRMRGHATDQLLDADASPLGDLAKVYVSLARSWTVQAPDQLSFDGTP
jgi:hypothetical protein